MSKLKPKAVILGKPILLFSLTMFIVATSTNYHKNCFYCCSVTAIVPTPLHDPAALFDRYMSNFVSYARRVERDIYETANSRVSGINRTIT